MTTRSESSPDAPLPPTQARTLDDECNCGSHKLAPLYHRPDCPAASPMQARKTGKDFLNMFLDVEGISHFDPVKETVVLAAMAAFAQYREHNPVRAESAPQETGAPGSPLDVLEVLKHCMPYYAAEDRDDFIYLARLPDLEKAAKLIRAASERGVPLEETKKS